VDAALLRLSLSPLTSARHDFRVLKAYDVYRKSLPAEQPDRPRDAEALRVWEDEGGAA
jgi:hypothetical protein